MAKVMTIPQRLEWILKQRGVSQNALARVAKVSPQTVANTLRHGRLPQGRTINKFAKALGVPNNVFSPTRTWTDDQLRKVLASGGAWTFTGATAAKKPAAKKATTRKPAAKKTTAKKAAAKKPAARKAVAKKATATRKPAARKTTAKKTTARKAVAKKPVARKAAAKKTTARKAVAKKPVARKTTAKKATVRKTVAKKPVARKAIAKKAPSRKIVRHSAVKRTAATRKPAVSSRRPARGGLTTKSSVDFNAIVSKLQKLANSRSEAIALDACKALLTLR